MDNTFGDLAMSGTAKNLLIKLRSNQITIDEFLRECAYWSLKDGFDELTPHQYPSCPTTQAFKEYDNLPLDRKRKVDSEYFRKNYEILEYFQRFNFIKSRNNAILDWLKEILKYLPFEDTIMRNKIENRMLEFQAFIGDDSDTEENLKTMFNGKEAE